MIEDKPHLIEKEVLDLRKYTVSALLSFGCRSKIKVIYYRLSEPLKGDKG